MPVTIDATHAVQLPGADPRSNGASTGGRRDCVPVLATAAVAAGATASSWNSIPIRTRRSCDGPSCLPLAGAEDLLADAEGDPRRRAPTPRLTAPATRRTP